MKMKLLVLLVSAYFTASSKSFGMVHDLIDHGNGTPFCATVQGLGDGSGGGGGSKIGTCLISTVTSGPTLLVQDTEVNLNNNESLGQMIAEANGDAEDFLTPVLAQKLNIDLVVLKNSIKSAKRKSIEQNIPFSVELILETIAK